MADNPLRLDPTRTAMVRRAWSADLQRRFDAVRSAVWKAVAVQRLDVLAVNAAGYTFDRDPVKLKKFNRWLQRQINDGILEINPQTNEPRNGRPWNYQYIDSAYRKGRIRAYTDAVKTAPPPGANAPVAAAFAAGRHAQFLESAFNRPERVGKLRLLYTRSYEDLKGVTAVMATKMSRALAGGIAAGQHPRAIARTMTKEISKLTRTRALLIAQTETIHAHAEGALDGLEDLGVERVNADVEFSTAGDDGVCPICQALNGKVYTIDEARGVIPVHPRCRCAWLPYVGEPGKLKPKRAGA